MEKCGHQSFPVMWDRKQIRLLCPFFAQPILKKMEMKFKENLSANVLKFKVPPLYLLILVENLISVLGLINFSQDFVFWPHDLMENHSQSFIFKFLGSHIRIMYLMMRECIIAFYLLVEMCQKNYERNVFSTVNHLPDRFAWIEGNRTKCWISAEYKKLDILNYNYSKVDNGKDQLPHPFQVVYISVSILYVLLGS